MWNFSSTAVTFDSTQYAFDGSGPPGSPTLTVGHITGLYPFTISWPAVLPSTGETTITYTVTRNRGGLTQTMSSNQTGLNYAVSGARSGDVYAVFAVDNNGYMSAPATYTFSPPNGFEGGFL